MTRDLPIVRYEETILLKAPEFHVLKGKLQEREVG